jgi:hypothetical protein
MTMYPPGDVVTIAATSCEGRIRMVGLVTICVKSFALIMFARSITYTERCRQSYVGKYSVIPWVAGSVLSCECGACGAAGCGLFATRRAWLVVWLMVLVCPGGRAFGACDRQMMPLMWRIGVRGLSGPRVGSAGK